MRKIYLMRHARAEGRKKGLPDADRALVSSGKENTKMMSRLFKKEGVKPDFIVSSPAKRAVQTARIVAKVLEYPLKDIQQSDVLYDAIEAPPLYNWLHSLPDDKMTVLVVGHNPALNILASSLVESFDQNIPKSGVVGIAFMKDTWRSITKKNGELILFDYAVDKTKMMKVVRRELTDKLSHRISFFFQDIDSSAAKRMEHSIQTTSKRLVRQFVEKGKHFRNYYLDIKAQEAEMKEDLDESKDRIGPKQTSEKKDSVSNVKKKAEEKKQADP